MLEGRFGGCDIAVKIIKVDLGKKITTEIKRCLLLVLPRVRVFGARDVRLKRDMLSTESCRW